MNFKNKVRMIGFYNKPNQNMKKEDKYVEEAKELSKLLRISFDYLINNEDVDVIFKSVILSNSVFILKDENNNLLAYYPLKGISRLSNVVYNKEAITQIPLQYKSWFIPGYEIKIYSIKKEKRNNNKDNYIITTSGSDFLITKGRRTLPLNWDEDCYISIKELYSLINDSWIYLYEYDTDSDCSDCDGYDYSGCDYSRCKNNCEKCGGRRYMCNNSCFNYRYDKALKMSLDFEQISNDVEPLMKILSQFQQKHSTTNKELFNQNYEILKETYQHCEKISPYMDINNTDVESYEQEFNYCSILSRERKIFNVNNAITIYLNGKKMYCINKQDLRCTDHAWFWVRYHLETNERTYDYVSDSLTSIDFKLKFNTKEERNKFKIDFDKMKIITIYLKEDKGDKYYIESYS